MKLVKVNEQELKNLGIRFVKEEDSITEVRFCLEGVEYIIKKASDYSLGLKVLTQEPTKLYQVTGEYQLGDYTTLVSQTFSSEEEANDFKQNIESQFQDVALSVNTFESYE